MFSKRLTAVQTAIKAVLFKQHRQAHPLGIEPELVDEGLQNKVTF